MDSARVTGLTKRLVLKLLGPETGPKKWESKYDASLNYSLRILGSRMAPTIVEDDFHLRETIKKKLARQNDFADVAVRFEELLSALMKVDTIVTKKWAILYLLHSLSSSKNQSSHLVLSGVSLSHVALKPQPQSLNPLPAQGRNVDPQTLTNNSLVKQNTTFEVPEEVLLRDIVFTFQGVNGKFIKFNENANCYAVINQVGVPMPVRNLIRQICELGWMYRNVSTAINDRVRSAGGLVDQSFCATVQAELGEYFRVIAVLETQMTNQPSNPSNQFTLRRLLVWVQQPRERLKLMSMLTEATQGTKGGNLLTVLSRFTHHGHPFVQAFLARILAPVSTPIIEMIVKWVTMGELEVLFWKNRSTLN
jgi:gamma-tubulin complex component 3